MNYPATITATYLCACKNCITLLPDRAIAAHLDFVFGFSSIPTIVFPSELNATWRRRFVLLLVTGWLSLPNFTASAFSTNTCRHTETSVLFREGFIPQRSTPAESDPWQIRGSVHARGNTVQFPNQKAE
jgi:hypothetical protein